MNALNKNVEILEKKNYRYKLENSAPIQEVSSG